MLSADNKNNKNKNRIINVLIFTFVMKKLIVISFIVHETTKKGLMLSADKSQ